MMELVRCISRRESNPDQVIPGKKYWMDTASVWVDTDDCEYATFYIDKYKGWIAGSLKTVHFEIVERPLVKGESLLKYINTHTALLLTDIITWCYANNVDIEARKILQYIEDNKIDVEENMYKEYVINNVSVEEYINREPKIPYEKYIGYSLYCVEDGCDNNLKKFAIRVTEELTRTVILEAKSYEEAEIMVSSAYDKCDIVLNADNSCVDVRFSDDTKNCMFIFGEEVFNELENTEGFE